MNITLDRMRYFLEAAKLEHVGLAGKSLGISPSVISAAIAALEEESGCSLFERSQKRIHLNERGRILKEKIEPILEQVRALSGEVNPKQAAFRGYLSVGGSHFLANHQMQDVANEVQKKNPELRIESSPSRTAQAIHDVLSGVLDYALCFSAHAHPALETVELYSGSMVVVVSKKHPLAKAAAKKSFKIDVLNKFPAIIHKSAPGVDYCENHPMFEKFGIQPNITQYYHSDDLCVRTLHQGDFWALVPDVVAKQYRSELIQISLPKNWDAPYDVSSVYRKTMKTRAIFAHFDEQLKKLLNCMGGNGPKRTGWLDNG